MELKDWLLIEEIVDLDLEVHIMGNKISLSSLRIPPTSISEIKETSLLDDFFPSLIGK